MKTLEWARRVQATQNGLILCKAPYDRECYHQLQELMAKATSATRRSIRQLLYSYSTALRGGHHQRRAEMHAKGVKKGIRRYGSANV